MHDQGKGGPEEIEQERREALRGTLAADREMRQHDKKHRLGRGRIRMIAGCRCLVALIILLACIAVGAPARAEGVGPLLIAKQGYFFVGGRYVDLPDGQYMAGQIYVEFQIPKKRRHPYPIVMIEGGGQSGSNFMGTP